MYLGPKKVAARKRLPRTHDLRFIEGGETFSPDVLAAFLADLSRSGGEPR